jgi:uncharacterized protein (DUF302 family)
MRTIIAILAMLLALPASADRIYRAQRDGDLVEAMNEVQNIIGAKGYKVLRVLPVDMGLENAGYSQEPYRIVFFGKDDLPEVLRSYPELVAYLPLSITVHQIGASTHFVAISPVELATADAGAALLTMLEMWDADIGDIFARLK